jgi:hypothetical protein
MRRATFKMVAAGDGSPPTPTGYCYYLLAHAVATVLLLMLLVAAVWQFMDWVVAPTCLESSSQSLVSTSTAAAAAGTTTAPTASPRSASPAPSIRLAARAELALDPGDCPCPKSGK